MGCSCLKPLVPPGLPKDSSVDPESKDSLHEVIDPSDNGIVFTTCSSSLQQAEITAWAWGSGAAFGEAEPIATPVQLRMKGRSLRGLGTAWEQSLLVASSGALWAAGVNSNHCLFEETSVGPQHAGKVDLLELDGRQVEAVAGGKAHIITILEDGDRVLSWGQSNEFGQLGHGQATVGAKVGPKAVALPRIQVRQVACGEMHSLVLTVAGSVFTFGDGSHGALGLGTTSSTSQPTCLDTGQIRATPLRAVAAGAHHSLALTISGDVLAWGCSKNGRLGLGDGKQDNVCTPARVPRLPEPVKHIAAGGKHSAVILCGHRCLLTGSNKHGQLGQTPTILVGSDMFLNLAGSWQAVALGDSHSLFLDCSGNVFSCGKSDQGQLGDGGMADPGQDPTDVLKRVRLPDGLAVFALATGPEHGLVLAGSSAAWSARRTPGAPDRPEDTLPASASSTSTIAAWAGVCASAHFGGFLEPHALKALARHKPEEAAEEVHRSLSTTLSNPTLLNASFCFPGLERPRIDIEGLHEAFDALWGAGLVSKKLESQFRVAAMQGLERWAGDPKEWQESPPNLVSSDQVRGMCILLLTPLVAEFENASDAYVLMARLVSLIAALPSEGRAAFTELIVEELASVLRFFLVLRVRRFCNAAIRRGVSEKHFNQVVWEGLLVLDLLASANAQIQQRLQEELLRVPQTKATDAADTSSAIAPVPAEDFELEALSEGVVPPEVEFSLFLQNTQAKIPKNEEILSARPHDERLHCFTVHRQLVPATFLRRVITIENLYRQNLQQQRGIQDMIMAALAGQVQIGPNGGLANVDQSKFFFPINVRRDHLLEDTLQILQDAAPQDLQKQLRVTFRGEQGQDAGGVSREFFRLLGRQLFTLQSLLFDKGVADEARVLWLDRCSPRESVDFWMLGVVLGLAVYNSLPGVDAHFPFCLFRKLRDEPLGLEDLSEVKPVVAASFRSLLAWKPEGELPHEKASAAFADLFCLDFSVSYEEDGRTKTQELKSGGKDIQVTLENRAEFVRLYVDWALVDSIGNQFDPFKKGFTRTCASPLLHALSGAELARIVMGESDIELANLLPRAKYEGFTEESQCIVWFWEVLRSFDTVQRRQFLSFTTGSDRAPVGGLGELQLTIQRQACDSKRLPSAHTCFNTLLLPDYSSKKDLQAALTAGIENAEGFGME